MNIGKSIVLGLILLGAIVYIYRVEIPQQHQAEQEEFLFSGIGGESIESVEVVRNAGSFTLKNSQVKSPSREITESTAAVPAPVEAWSLESLPKSPLDATALKALLTGLTSLKGGKAIAPENVNSDLGVYGLTKPEVTLKVRFRGVGEDTKSAELQFGKKNDYLGERYLRVMRGGDKAIAELFLVTDTLFSAANKDRESFRKRQLIEFSESSVQSIAFTSSQGSITVQPAAASSAGALLEPPEWNITAPRALAASNQAITDWLKALRTIRVKEFIDAESGAEIDAEAATLESYGLRNPELSIQVTFTDETKREPLQVGLSRATKQPSDTVTPVFMHVKEFSGIYRLEADPFPSLEKNLDALRETKIFRVVQDRINKVEIEKHGSDSSDGSGATITLVRDGENWTVNGRSGDKTFIEQYLRDLSDITALGFPHQSANYGFDKPYLKVSVSGAGEADAPETASLVVGKLESKVKDGEGLRYAFVGDEALAFTLSPEAVTKLAPRLETLVSLETSSVSSSSAPEAAAQE